MEAPIEWLSASSEPWTRYRTMLDLQGLPENSAPAMAARLEMLAHPEVRSLIIGAAAWGEQAIKRHNDAASPVYKLSVLADFGLKRGDAGVEAVLQSILARQATEGPFLSLLNIPRAFGGTGEDQWSWLLCDAPVLLYILLAMDGPDIRLERALEHLAGLVEENGYRCRGDPTLGKFRGPGRRSDPCPVANVYALKALSQSPAHIDSCPVRLAADMLLDHWEQRRQVKYYLFGIGSDFVKVKYPFV